MKTLVVLLSIVVILLAGSFIYDHLTLTRGLRMAEDALIKMRQERAADEARHQAEVKQYEEANAVLMGMVTSSHTVIADLEGQVEAKDKKIQSIRLEFTKVDAECRGLLVALDNAWADKYAVAEAMIEEYKMRDDLRVRQLDNQQKIINSLNESLGVRDRVINAQEETIKGLGLRLHHAQKQGNLKAIVVGGAVLGGLLLLK